MTRPYKHKFDRAMYGQDWDGDDGSAYRGGRKRYRRNKIDGVLGGVCAGIGDYTGLDPVIIRALAILFFLVSGPIAIFIYLGFVIFTPSDKRAPYYREYREYRRAQRRQARAARRARRTHRRASTPEPVRSTTSYRDVKSKFRSLEQRMQDLEKSITSSEWQLRRKFRDIEN